jgi:hypothetical protein
MSTRIDAEGKPTEKFALFVDLGILTVPGDYEHASQLERFRRKHGYLFDNPCQYNNYSPNLCDSNFPNPTRLLSPGDRFHVRAFRPVFASGTSNWEDCLVFLATQQAVLTGAQGLSLVFELMFKKMRDDIWYASLDAKDRLWANSHHMVPGVIIPSGMFVTFSLHRFESFMQRHDAFLCFTEVR